MKKLVFNLALLLVLISACVDQSIKLPLSDFRGIQDTIYDNSKIWVFNEQGIAELNWSDRIGTTDWLINIDRNLSLGQVLPILDKIQEKRKAKSMHKKENAVNYMTYANPRDESIQILPVKRISFGGKPRFPEKLRFNQENIRFQNNQKIDSLWEFEMAQESTYQDLIVALSRIYEEQPQNFARLASVILVKND